MDWQDQNSEIIHLAKKKKKKIPLALTYHCFLPNFRNAVRKHWSILSGNKLFKDIFQNEPKMAFKRNKSVN